MRCPRRRARLLWLAAFTAATCAILVGLGQWQLQRHAVKETLIAAISARAAAAPEALPDPAEWPRLRPEDYDYRHVTIEGIFARDKEVLLFRPSGGRASGLEEPGYLVLTALRLASGAHVIVNRGFVPLSLLESTGPDSAFSYPADTGPIRVTGLMRAPEPRNLFTPLDEPARRRYFTRDPATIAAHFGLNPSAPFSIDADVSTGPGDWPKGGTTVLRIPDNHLAYALTWFGLATTAAAVFGTYAWTQRQAPT